MEITYINDSGSRITLKQTKPFFLSSVSGTGQTKQTINTFTAPMQDGAFYISSALDMRNITLEGTIASANSDLAYEYRKRLLRVFTPKLQGTLVYREKQIACVVEEVLFTVSSREKNPKFYISLLCPSPFFESPDEVRKELAVWSPLFSFRLEIPSTGMEFGERQPSQIITVDNDGDVSCGCLIVFKALGGVENPELMNIDTGEYVKINATMSANEEIKIYTHFAGKKVIRTVSQTESNAFSDLDTGSTFLQLNNGRNRLRYDAETNMDLLEVSIYYRPRFLGV